ncbi:MAG TPA: hypothetical protein VG223_18785 [Solirubrobacteraceae bacterium]|nr:hypothetical protein [Solirubrobacteraceae bacterium]
MRHIPRALLAGGLGFAVALLVAACGGSSSLLSAGQASTLDAQLSSVASAINAGNCTQAGTAAQNFDNAVSNLPSSVDATLTNNLKQASSALAAKAAPDCQNGSTQSIPTTTKKTPTTPTKTTSTTATGTTTTATGPNPTKTGTGSGTTSTPATTGTNPGSTTTTGASGGAPVTGTSTSGNGNGGAPTGNGN